MQISTFRNARTEFKQNGDTRQSKNKNLKLGIALGALATPILPLLDGDSFKKTYKNRNIAKLTTGVIGVGGLFALSHILASDSQDSKTRFGIKAITGAIVLPLLLLVDKWAQTENKTFSKKWYAISALVGAGLMCINEKMKNK